MAIPYEFTELNIDLDDIREQVSASLGRPVGVVARWPVKGRPGILLFEDDTTTERIDVDPAVVDVALTVTRAREAARDADPGQSVYTQLLADLGAAGTDVAARWAVVGRLLAALARQEAAENLRATTTRARLKQRFRESLDRAAKTPEQPFVHPRELWERDLAANRSTRRIRDDRPPRGGPT
jgi:hypothetical protein